MAVYHQRIKTTCLQEQPAPLARLPEGLAPGRIPLDRLFRVLRGIELGPSLLRTEGLRWEAVYHGSTHGQLLLRIGYGCGAVGNWWPLDEDATEQQIVDAAMQALAMLLATSVRNSILYQGRYAYSPTKAQQARAAEAASEATSTKPASTIPPIAPGYGWISTDGLLRASLREIKQKSGPPLLTARISKVTPNGAFGVSLGRPTPTSDWTVHYYADRPLLSLSVHGQLRFWTSSRGCLLNRPYHLPRCFAQNVDAAREATEDEVRAIAYKPSTACQDILLPLLLDYMQDPCLIDNERAKTLKALAFSEPLVRDSWAGMPGFHDIGPGPSDER
jgi:hypothetical protein